MEDDQELHALYRYRGTRRRRPPLYIGRTNNPGRRFGEHQHHQSWIYEASRIDMEWVPASEIADAERRAIIRERPLYNKTHNGARLRIEATVEIEVAPMSPETIAAMLAMIVAAGMASVWLLDSLANWNVRRRAAAAGQDITVPPARNLFAQDPEHWSATFLAGLLVAASPPRPDGTRPPAPAGLADLYASWSALPVAAQRR
jgi:predicted GIY-YIG superfamily endonuclease